MEEIPPTRQTSAESLVDEPLIERIRHFVLYGGHQVDRSLSEVVLAQQFGVSRTPVREVLKQLVNEGLVEVRPKVGTFIKTPTREEIIELFELKESMEGLGASLMARRAPTDAIQLLKENIKRSEDILDGADPFPYTDLVHEFHWTIILESGNKKLVDHYHRLMNQLAYQSIVLQTVTQPGRLRASINEHIAVVDAIARYDSMEAEIAMRNHVTCSGRAALLVPGLSSITQDSSS